MRPFSLSQAPTTWAEAQRTLRWFDTTQTAHLGCEVPLTRRLMSPQTAADYEAESGWMIVEPFATDEIEPLDASANLVAAHAPFIWGAGASAAVENATAIAFVAGIALATLRLNPNSHGIPDALLDHHFARKDRLYSHYPEDGSREVTEGQAK